MISRAPLGIMGFTKSSNYVNKQGKHPKVQTVIDHWKIVLKPEELEENKWLYIGNEKKEDVEFQLELLKKFRDWVPIIE